MSNFIDPNVLKSTNDITSIKLLGVGTSTRMLLCVDFKMKLLDFSIESKFFKSVRSFM